MNSKKEEEDEEKTHYIIQCSYNVIPINLLLPGEKMQRLFLGIFACNLMHSKLGFAIFFLFLPKTGGNVVY